jgi:hypothetical protein
MERIISVSRKTLQFTSVLSLFWLFLSMNVNFARSASDPETERLENEAAEARNAFDAEMLKPNAKATDPKVKAKATAVEEKTKALREHFRKRVTVPKESAPKKQYVVDKDLDNGRTTDASPDPSGERDGRASANAPLAPESPARRSEPAREPQPGYTLSADGVKSEITYEKKPEKKTEKKNAKKSALPSPVPTEENEAAPVPPASGEGISEIQYPKKTKK